MTGPGQVALLLLVRPLIRIRELKGKEGLAAFVLVKVIVCAISGVARCRKMTDVPLRMSQSNKLVSEDLRERTECSVPVRYTYAEYPAFPSPAPRLVIGASL